MHVNRHPAATAGGTLLEMILAATLVTLALGVSYPSVVRAIESARVRAAADEARTFLFACQQFADRNRQAVVVRVEPGLRRIDSRSEDGRWQRVLEIPSSVRVVSPPGPVTQILHPGIALPSIELSLESSAGIRSAVRTGPFGGPAQ